MIAEDVENVVKNLPRLQRPEAAVAEANQRQAQVIIPTPRGVVTRQLPNTPTNYIIPHAQSANWFKEVFNGYMTAQTVLFSEYATDTLKLLHAEDLELEHAYKHPQTSLDDSLLARKASIWLLAEYGNNSSSTLDQFLDALSMWSSFKPETVKVVNMVRMTAVFGTDAKFMLDKFKQETSEDIPSLETGEACVAIRWHNGHRIRTETRYLKSENIYSAAYNAVRILQDSVVRLSGVYDIPIPNICMRPVPVDIFTQDHFYRNMHNTSLDFFNMLIGTPSITYSQEVISRNASRILQPSKFIVRVCNRARGEDGISHPSSFHGAVIGLANKRNEIELFIQQSDASGIRPPLSKEDRSLGLHLCAVQAESMRLGPLISLFGTLGACGNIIHAPGSWIWVARPAVRPIQADLLNVFALHPCSHTSLLPARNELIPSFERFWKHTTELYKMIESGSNTFHKKLDSELVRSESPKSITTMDYYDNTSALITMMNLDTTSMRTTLGVVYVQVSMIQESHQFAENIKQAMSVLQNGVRATLYDMFKYNQEMIKQSIVTKYAKQEERDPLIQLSEIALDMASESLSKRQKTNASHALCATPERVKRILKACGLKSNMHVTLECSKSVAMQQERYTGVIHDIVLETTKSNSVVINIGPEVSRLIKRSSYQLFQRVLDDKLDNECSWPHHVEHALGMATAIALVSMKITDPIFMLTGSGNEQSVCVKKINLDGSLTLSSFDSMCAMKSPKVLIVQEVASTRVRISNTIRSD